MTDAVPPRLLAASLLALCGGAGLAGLQLSFGPLPLPPEPASQSEPPPLPGWTPRLAESLPAAALHAQSRGRLHRWRYTANGHGQALELIVVPISVRNRLDLSLQRITSHDPALKSLVLRHPWKSSGAVSPSLHLARGQLAGPSAPPAVQTCVVPPAQGQAQGTSGINYKQLAQSIAARNRSLNWPGFTGKLAEAIGLRPQAPWSCTLVSLSAAGSSTLADRQLSEAAPLVLQELMRSR